MNITEYLTQEFGMAISENPPKVKTGEGAKTRDTVKIQASLSGVMALMKDLDNVPFNLDHNKRKAVQLLTGNDDSGAERGGTYQDLCDSFQGKLDMAPFIAERTKFDRNGLLSKLQTNMKDFVPRRKRALSEYDGEWDLTRRWDLTPFSNAKKTYTPGRTIDILVHFGISAHATAEEINQYGCLAWAISDLIESAGVSTRLVIVDSIRAHTSSYDKHTWIETEIKKPGQYIAPSLVAATHRSNFFRRVSFAMIAIAADYWKEDVRESLGTPGHRGEPIEFKDGQLIISPDVVRATSEELERELLKAIGSKQTAAA